MSKVAEKAGLERTHLYRKLKQLNIRFSRRTTSPRRSAPPPRSPSRLHPTAHLSRRRHRPQGRRPRWSIGAIGVVYGDIGTSPLYMLRTAFTGEHGAARSTPANVYGVLSVVFWALVVVVTLKYITLIMRADNNGEGGILALTALVSRGLRAATSGAAGGWSASASSALRCSTATA